jgi:hypothetical protein
MNHIEIIQDFKKDRIVVIKLVKQLHDLIVTSPDYGPEIIFRNSNPESLEIRVGMYEYYLIRIGQITNRNAKTYQFSIHKSIYDAKNVTMEDNLLRRVIYDKQAIDYITINESKTGEMSVNNVTGAKEILDEIFGKLRYDIFD